MHVRVCTYVYEEILIRQETTADIVLNIYVSLRIYREDKIRI